MKAVTGSVRGQEMVDAITRPKDVQKDVQAPKNMVRYNANGESDAAKKRKFSDDETCALEFTVGKNKVYRVKSKRGGQLYNPLKSGLTYGLHVIDKTTNGPMFTFREINFQAFDAYVRFLARRQDSLLLTAERES